MPGTRINDENSILDAVASDNRQQNSARSGITSESTGGCSLFFPTTPPAKKRHFHKPPPAPSKRKLVVEEADEDADGAADRLRRRMNCAAARRLDFLETRRQRAIDTRPRLTVLR